MRPICDRFRTQRIASLPCVTMCLWHAERVSATNQSERGERRGGALRGTQNAPQKAKLSEGRFGEAEPEGCASIRECAAAFRRVRPLIANGDHVPTGR